MSIERDKGALAFAEKLLVLLGEGHFTATYKYAVLLGLMDLCMEHVSRTGQPPESVTTRQLAEKAVELYWQHTARFPVTETVLRQNQGTRDSQAAIVSAIVKFREKTSCTCGRYAASVCFATSRSGGVGRGTKRHSND